MIVSALRSSLQSSAGRFTVQRCVFLSSAVIASGWPWPRNPQPRRLLFIQPEFRAGDDQLAIARLCAGGHCNGGKRLRG